MATHAHPLPGCGAEKPDRAGTDRPTNGTGEPTLEGAFAADGVDLTVIRWMLERSPAERLQAAQRLVDIAWALRRAET